MLTSLREQDQMSCPKTVTSLCLLPIGIGILVLIGWASDNETLKSVVPGYITMKANTAIGFILLGLSCFLLKSEKPKKTQFIFAGICSFLVFQIGLLTLLQYFYHFNFGIDEFFFKDLAGLSGRFPPGRLAPITAIEFLILPIAIILGRSSSKHFFQLSQFLVLMTFLIAFQAIIGYLTGVTYTFGSAYYTQMALHTTLAFVSVCCSLVLARPKQGFAYLFFLKSAAGKSMRQLILAAILMPPLVHLVKRAGQNIGLYDADFSVIVQLMGNTVFLLYVIVRNTSDLHKTEITREKADLELKEREERFRLLAESVPQLIWSTKADGEYDFFNQQWLTYTGLEPEHFLSSNWKDIIHPDDFAKVAEDHRLSLEKNFFETEYRIKNSKGDYEWFLSRTVFIRDQSGKILKKLTTATNVNAQKKIQEEKTKNYAEQTAAHAIRQSESRLRAIFTNAFDGIVGMDATGIITAWNPQAEKIFGYQATEAIGLPMIDLIIAKYPTLSNQDSYHRFNQLEDAKMNHLMKVEVIRKNKEHFPAQIVITPIRVDETIFFTAFIADITEREKADTELRYAREQAENAAKMKSEFLANMSHEIRTPLNGIIGMTDLLIESGLNEQQNKFSKIIQNSSNNLLSIINDILDFSKIDAGKLDLEVIDFDLVSLIEGQAELLGARAREKNLSFMTFIDPDLPTSLKGDPGRIGQILLNLTSNAIKFTPSGSVSIRAEKHPEGNNKVLFSVQDTGLGLSQNAQKKLFQAFTQADGSTARRYGGTGLGLSISKQLVTLMNGSIGVDSEESVGSNFCFVLSLPPATLKGSQFPPH